MRYLVLLLAVQLLGVRAGSGSPADSADVVLRRVSWTVLPILFSSPDTGFGFGVLPQFIYRIAPDARPSSSRVEAYYTQERQFNVGLSFDAWTRANRYVLGGRVRLRDWPTTYFASGNVVDGASSEPYRERSAEVSLEARRRIHETIFLGVSWELRSFQIDDLLSDGILEDGSVSGSRDGVIGGLGIQAQYDTRDVTFAATKGSLIALSSGLFRPIMGSDFSFSRHKIDVRHYRSLLPNHVLALQFVFSRTEGDVPFQVLPGVGEELRGFKSKSLNDRQSLVAQAAYRVVPIWWRLGAELFVGAGQTASSLGDFSLAGFHLACGLGLRFQVMQSERVHVRWDFGFSREGMRDYIDIDEAF